MDSPGATGIVASLDDGEETHHLIRDKGSVKRSHASRKTAARRTGRWEVGSLESAIESREDRVEWSRKKVQWQWVAKQEGTSSKMQVSRRHKRTIKARRDKPGLDWDRARILPVPSGGEDSKQFKSQDLY